MRKHIATVTAMLGGAAAHLMAQNTSPNIVVILADDLGLGDVSAYGATTIDTPNIDKIAREGVSFTNAYATSATSTPSRYGLLTGVYPWKSADAKILDGDAALIIDTEGYTLPKMMQQQGYATAAVGKWHLGMGNGQVNWNEEIVPGPREVGFDFSCVAAATNDRVPTVFVEDGRVLDLDPADPIYVDYKHPFEGEPTGLNNPEMMKMLWSHGHNNAIINGIPRIGYMKGGEKARWIDEDLADFYLAKAKDFVSDNADRPFFLYYGLHQPHVPRTPHPRFAGTTTMGPRGDAIVEADWCVGQLMQHLDSLQLLDNTIVIFSSDNGPVLDDGYADGAAEMLGDHSPTAHRRGGKYSLFDGGTHVPLFVYWQGVTAPKVSDALVCQLDIAASLARLTGGDIPAVDSEDHLDTFLGKTESGRDNLVFEAQGRLGYRSGKWIMIPPYKGNRRNNSGNELGNLSTYALYDVEADPGQQHDIAATHPKILDRLKAEFLRLTGRR